MNPTTLQATSALHRTDRAFRTDPAKSFTLPARFYTSPELHVAEKSAIFEKCWFYVGHRSQLADAGAYITATVYDQEVFVTRTADGVLNAFYNVCKHRGHQVLEGSGRTRAITCPYHAWVYGLDGSLRRARNTAGMESFGKCDRVGRSARWPGFCAGNTGRARRSD